ncbi:MAG: hypothetical protein QOE19_1696 [Actinomycetota bacterium]|nr:hypothetical protein [Actinomycetota bacterium]
MGRHRAPPDEHDEPLRAPLVVGAAALVVVLALLVVIFVTTRGDGDDGVTTRQTSASNTPATSTPAPSPSTGATTSPAAKPSATASTATPPPPKTKRPPTLTLRMTGTSYVTVRQANGRTLTSKIYRKGQRKTFDQKYLRVIIGNAAAVHVTVNGKPREAGRKGEVETFTARRK